MQELLGTLSTFGIDMNELEKSGINLPTSLVNTATEEICFETKRGTYCEVIPKNVGITCDDDGTCDIFMITTNNALIKNKNALDALGIKTFLQPSGAFPKIGMSGRFKISNLEAVKAIVGKNIPIKRVKNVRSTMKGHVPPPKECDFLPFLPQCKNFIENTDWMWLPIGGWFELTKKDPTRDDTYQERRMKLLDDKSKDQDISARTNQDLDHDSQFEKRQHDKNTVFK